MPNWCMNELTVEGQANLLKHFVFSSQGLPAKYPLQEWEKKFYHERKEPTEHYFCFNALVPTPDAVLQMGYDAHDKLPEHALMFSLVGGPFEPIDGYHWNIQNWGTKWDVYSDKITPEDMGWQEGCENISFVFYTAWSPPIMWFDKIIEMSPALQFKLHYEEPGCYFAGNLIYHDGALEDIQYNEEQCAELFSDPDEEPDETLLIQDMEE